MEYIGIIFVVAIRLLVPLTIIRWPFWGAIAAIFADTIDLGLLNFFGWRFSNGIEYQSLDKILDIYYLSFEWVVVLRLKNIAVRRTLSALFIWRAIGVVFFEITHLRYILLFAPNIFEYAYLVVIGAKKFFAGRGNLLKVLAGSLIIIAPLKIIQEYIMHYKEIPFGLGTVFKYLMSLF